MRKLLKKYFTVFLTVLTATLIFPNFSVQNGWYGLLYSTTILGLIIMVIRPIINILLFPLNILTLNFLSWIVNIILVLIWISLDRFSVLYSWDFPGFRTGILSLSGVFIPRWQMIIIFGISVTIINKFINWLIK